MIIQFFGFGIVLGLWSGSVPFVAEAAHMATADLGFAFTLFTGAYILAMTLGGKCLAMASPRRIMVIAIPFNALAIIGLLLAKTPAMLTASLIMLGLVMGLIDLVMNTEGTLVEADLKRTVLARMHCFASIGTALGAIAGSAFALTLGVWASSLLGVVALGIGMAAILVATPERPVLKAQSGGLLSAYSTVILLFGILFGIGAVGENAAQIWSARLLAEQAPALAVIAGLGVSFFAGCQAVMRFFGDQLRRRFGDTRLVAGSLVVAMAGFAVVGTSSSFAGSVVGFALIGVGTAMQVPCLFALAAASNPLNGGAALALVALLAGGPRLVAPWAFGEIASQTSTGTAFGTIAALYVVAIVLSVNVVRRVVS
jgi:MFS family permease